jgi:L-fuculose-phosphate aldolase
MYDKGFVAATDGNISVRLGRNRLLTTPSGLCKGEVKPEQLVVTDLSGKKISGKLTPSSEIRMHLCAYRERSDITAVIHAHPPIATAFSIAGVSLAKCILPEVVFTMGTIPTTRYATPTTEEGPDVILDYIGDYDAFILDRHGTLTVGDSLESAYYKLEKVEHTAHVTMMARQLGSVNLLEPDQINRLLKLREKFGITGRKPIFQHCGACPSGREKGCTGSCRSESLVEAIAEEIQKEQA